MTFSKVLKIQSAVLCSLEDQWYFSFTQKEKIAAYVLMATVTLPWLFRVRKKGVLSHRFGNDVVKM